MFGEHEDGTLAQMRNCMAVGNVVAGTICADGHPGYAQPIGGVIGYEGQISISGVGFDIGCGNMAIRLDTPYAAIKDRVGEIIRDVAKVISFGVGRKNEERVEHALFDDGEAWRASDMEAYRPKAAGQLGTVGSGNHYVDLLHDAEGLVWIGVHFGSRGLGHTSATRYLKAAGGKDGMNVPPAVIDEASELGQRYIAAMELAGRYAYAGREWVCERVRKIVGGAETDRVHNHHNYAWRERHNDRDLWVVRKGATPAFPGQRGFVGGSMGDDAVIVEGVDGDGSARIALLDRSRRRAPVRPQGGEAALHARADGCLADRARRRAGRRGSRRKPDGLPAPARRAGASRAARSACCTRCARSRWRWRAKASSTRSRTRPPTRQAGGAWSFRKTATRFSGPCCGLARIVADLARPLADGENLLPAAVQAFVGLQLLIRLRRMRLEARRDSSGHRNCKPAAGMGRPR